jgi:serine/threonine protein kinase
MSLTTGTKLGPYEILSLIGAGGMGEVYKALDTKLGREVAIKVLPEAFAKNKERLARFEREAQLLASLNHPNIATLFDLQEHDGIHFLVLEFVPGETLAERIKRGPIPVDEGLPLFKQIAEGLEAAHEKGIIHRDLKPANIKITPEDKVKVLDFGLAKALVGDEPPEDSSQSPTLTKGTALGTVMGTAAYMSPEQARGKPVDRRADLWAFGCVLYEALTGNPAFSGETVTDILTGVIHREPDWSALPANTPWRMREIVQKCLRKNSRDRLQHIGDARVELETHLNEPAGDSPALAKPATPLTRIRQLVPWAVAVLCAAVAFFALWGNAGERLRSPSAARFTVELPENLHLSNLSQPAIAVSPDGERLVYVANDEGGRSRLYRRDIDSLETLPLADTENASYPFFSPDGEWLGFLQINSVEKMLVAGGVPSKIYDLVPPSVVNRGAHWGPEDQLLVVPDRLSVILEGTATGRELESLTELDPAAGELAHHWPELLPGGRALLFTIVRGDDEEFDIAAQSLETGERRVLVEGGSAARYVPTGHLVYSRAGTLMAAPFDPERIALTGPPVSILENVLTDLATGAAQFDITNDGTLFYVPGQWKEPQRQLVWVDRKGRVEPMAAERRAYAFPDLSDDGEQLLVEIEGANTDVWLYDISRGSLTRLTTHRAEDMWPLWSPGRRVTFFSFRLNLPSMYWKPVDVTEPEELILPRRLEHYTYYQKTETGEKAQFPASWSPDGKYLLYVEDEGAQGKKDLWMWSEEDGTKPFVRSSFDEMQPTFSPDGRWVAYISDQSGRYEVYVRSFPSGERAIQVSVGGGVEPVWAPGGNELFYRNEDKMMVVPISMSPSFTPGTPALLFEKAFEHPTSYTCYTRASYDVTPDAHRFVMVQSEGEEPPPRRIHVILDWFEELKRLVPTN